MFISRKSAQQQPLDSYTQLKLIVQQLLQAELPNHSPYHHILFTANARIQSLQEAVHKHRTYQIATTAIGQFHQQQYEQQGQKLSQLKIMTESYIQLADDTQQAHLNHRLTFYKEAVNTQYQTLQQLNYFDFTSEEKQQFLHALQTDCIPILYALFDPH